MTERPPPGAKGAARAPPADRLPRLHSRAPRRALPFIEPRARARLSGRCARPRANRSPRPAALICLSPWQPRAVNLLRGTAVGRGGDRPSARRGCRALWRPPRGTAPAEDAGGAGARGRGESGAGPGLPSPKPCVHDGVTGESWGTEGALRCLGPPATPLAVTPQLLLRPFPAGGEAASSRSVWRRRDLQTRWHCGRPVLRGARRLFLERGSGGFRNSVNKIAGTSVRRDARGIARLQGAQLRWVGKWAERPAEGAPGTGVGLGSGIRSPWPRLPPARFRPRGSAERAWRTEVGRLWCEEKTRRLGPQGVPSLAPETTERAVQLWVRRQHGRVPGALGSTGRGGRSRPGCGHHSGYHRSLYRCYPTCHLKIQC